MDKWNQFIYSKINKLYRTNDIQSFHNENRIAKKNVYIAPISMANHKMKQEKKNNLNQKYAVKESS